MRRFTIFGRPAATTDSSDPAATLIMSTKADPSLTAFLTIDAFNTFMTNHDSPINWTRFWENVVLVCSVVSVVVGSMIIIGTLLADSWVGRLVTLAGSLIS